MNQIGYYDGEYEASYLELAQLLAERCDHTKEDLAQLCHRIAISNTDDHLCNHEFTFLQGGWKPPPAHDNQPAHGLHLNISDHTQPELQPGTGCHCVFSTGHGSLRIKG